MNQTAIVHVEPVVKMLQVKASPARAFEVFTAGMKRWWIPEFSINPTRAAIADVVIEPRVGGRWYERGVDGSECDWGRVLLWGPPTRLVLAWQINAQYQFDAALQTELELRFSALSKSETQVTLEHRHLERMGASGAHVRDQLNGGWGTLMERFAAAIG
jgi:activator of Hsp90 ATPase-like protein